MSHFYIFIRLIADLVCQELSSGYLFFEVPSDKRDAETWDNYLKKTFELTS
jgi:hypothetical protein